MSTFFQKVINGENGSGGTKDKIAIYDVISLMIEQEGGYITADQVYDALGLNDANKTHWDNLVAYYKANTDKKQFEGLLFRFLYLGERNKIVSYYHSETDFWNRVATA